MGRLDVNQETKMVDLCPLQGFIVCKTNEARAQRIMMGDSKIIAPFGDAQLSGGSEYTPDGRKQTQMKVAVEEVVQQGPGAVVDGMWQEPNCRQGDMLVYDTSVSPISFTIGGQKYTLVHQRHVIMTCRDVAVEDGQA
jgi:co-chaperonin GroES (HSP10)